MPEKLVNRVANSIPDEDCFDIKGVAAELGIGVQRARQIMNEAISTGRIQNLTKMVGPKKLYAPQMVERLRELYISNSIVKRRKRNQYSESALRAAEEVIQIPIFDKDVYKVLIGKFGSKEEITKHLQAKLTEEYRPVQNLLHELEERHRREREQILKGMTSNGTK